MANQPTIVVANLDDAKLKASIDKMVNDLNAGLNKMTANTDAAVRKMQASLQSVGNVKFGGENDGGSTRRTKKQQEETDAVKQTAKAYDQLAQTQQKSTQVKSARESYYAFVQGYKEQAKALNVLVQQAEGAYSQAVGNKIMQLNMRLNDTRKTMQELHNEFQRERVTAMSTGDMTRVNALLERIRNVGAQIERLKAELASVPTTMLVKSDEGRRLQALRDEHSRILNIMREEVSVQQQQNTSVNNQISAQERLANKIRRQAEIIRERFNASGTGTATWGNAVIYDPNDARNAKIKQARLSIEDQLLQKHQEQVRVTNERLALEERERQAKQQTLGVTQQLAGAEQKVTEAQEKRSNTYQPKTFQSYDDLRESIAHVLKVRTQDVNLANAETASYDRLNASLKIMQQAYNKLGANDRASEQGRALAASIQEVQRALHKIQSQASRPVRLENILGFQPKTLDDIVYKIQMLQRYREGIDFTNPKTKGEIEQVNQALEKLRQEQSKILGQNKEMLASNNALVRSFNYMKNRLAFYFTVGASTQFVKSLIDIRSQYEMNERALGILINSAERGTQIFKELSEMALVSPYTLIELSSAAKQLVAYDIAARDVVDTTRRLADMASAVGVPMERLTYALGQIKAYGYLNSRDARMFANAGIPLVKQLAEHYTELEGKMVSTAEVYDRMKKKAIDYNDVMAVVTKMTDDGGKFFNFQAKMADTLKVRLANLTLAWNNMMNEIGASNQGVLTWTIGALRDLFAHWKGFDSALKSAAWTGGLIVALRALNVLLVKSGVQWGILSKQMTTAGIAGAGVARRIAAVGVSLKNLVTSPLTWWSLLAFAIVDATRALINMNKAQEALNKSIRDGAEDNYNSISKFAEQYKQIRDSLYTKKDGKTVPVDIDKNEAKKAWETVREEIELTSKNAETYIGQLLSISNMSERVRQGFNILDNISAVNAALKELDDDSIKIEQDYSQWWNLWMLPDGLIGNLNDLVEAEKELIEVYGSVDAAKKSEGKLYTDYEKRELANFRKDLKITTDSILDFISLKGWSGDTEKINEVFKQITDKISIDNQLDPQKAFTLQLEVEEARSKAAKNALAQRINDEAAAYKVAQDENARTAIKARYDALREEYATFEKFNGKTRVYWTDFTKWLKEQHISETREMFKGMDAAQIQSLNFQEGKYKEWVTRMVERYAKEHKMSYDSAFSYLKNWVTNANKWSIFIPLTISTEDKKSIYETLTEADTAIDTAYKKIQRLKQRQKELNEKGGLVSDDDKVKKDSERIIEEIAAATKDYNDALEKGGHSKKEDAAATKAQKQAETELQKALKDELQLIEKVRSTYKTLTKEEMNHLDAITAATNGYEESVANVNNVLRKYGLELDLSKFAGIENPHGLVVMLQKQLDTLLGKAKPAEIQALQVKIKDIKVDAAAFDQKTFATSLNDQLGKLKDEYELAIALDADPELGESFASLIGLDLDSLPRTVSEYAKRATDYLNEYMDKNKTGIQLPSVELTNQQLKDLKDMVDTNVLNAKVYERIKKVVNEIREARKKEMEEHIKDWNKLIEKYSEYETKIKNIQNATAKERRELVRTFGNEAQQATAVQLETQIRAENDPAARQALIGQLADLADQVSAGNPVAVKLKVAITNKDEQNIAKAGFEEFQKSPEWIIATGDLATMSTNAIGLLIDKLSDYKKSAKNLDPKQIKQLNNALKNLYREQRKANPFAAMATAIEQAKENAALFDDKIEDTKSKIKETEKEIAQAEKYGFDTTQMKEQLDSLKNALTELENAKDGFNSIDPSIIVEGINGAIAVAQKASEAFTDMMNALGGKNGSGDAQAINQMFTILGKAGSYAAMGAQIGGGYGAVIGGILGAVSSVVTMFADEWSGNASITRAVQRSERAVKRLELSYIDLKHAMDEAYGTAEIGAQRAIVVNKELQLVELKRQLQLEESRKGKNRDADRILELKKQIKELEYDIVDSINGITNSLLGISSIGNAAETLVTNMIAAFKKGEQFMDEYKQTFDDMIDNMIMKAIVSNVIGNRLQEMFDRIQQTARERAKKEEEAYASAYKEFESSSKWADKLGEYAEFYNFDPYADKVLGDKNKKITREQWEALWQERLEYLKKQYEEAMTPTPEDVQGVRDDVQNWKDSVKEEFMAYMDAFGIKYGQDSTKNLSALQQGIQGVTETTAQAVEAYLNGMSQQAYLRNDLLTQIRDIVVGFDLDIQLGVMSQMLLQLQNSYILMQSMAAMMDNWTVPAGNGIRVELLS